MRERSTGTGRSSEGKLGSESDARPDGLARLLLAHTPFQGQSGQHLEAPAARVVPAPRPAWELPEGTGRSIGHLDQYIKPIAAHGYRKAHRGPGVHDGVGNQLSGNKCYGAAAVARMAEEALDDVARREGARRDRGKVHGAGARARTASTVYCFANDQSAFSHGRSGLSSYARTGLSSYGRTGLSSPADGGFSGIRCACLDFVPARQTTHPPAVLPAQDYPALLSASLPPSGRRETGLVH